MENVYELCSRMIERNYTIYKRVIMISALINVALCVALLIKM